MKHGNNEGASLSIHVYFEVLLCNYELLNAWKKVFLMNEVKVLYEMSNWCIFGTTNCKIVRNYLYIKG